MGYILHLIDAPTVTSASAAETFIAQQRKLAPKDNVKFSGFVREISSKYPDLSDEDEDGDNDENLWEEGLDPRASYGSVKELVVKVDVADESVIAVLAAAAVKNGLKLYDQEGQVVYPE